MKICLFIFFTLLFALPIHAQAYHAGDSVIITWNKGKTTVKTDEAGLMILNISLKERMKINRRGWVEYGDLGAKGDGKTDDLTAIAATHALANELTLPVKASDNAVYYIGGSARIAIIRTNTDFGSASFIIDDTRVENHNAPVFLVESSLPSFHPDGLTTLKRDQQHLDLALCGPCLISVTNEHVKHYIRYGLNQDNGASQTDIFLVDADGNVDQNAPILWDFDQITDVSAQPIDMQPLIIRGGRFTTIANQAESKYTYYSRNLAIRRSNVQLIGLEHRIEGEGDHGAPYGGFINISECANVQVRNTILTGHKTYQTIGSAGKPVSMGTYDIIVNRALNVSFVNCRQTNDIDDRTYWGIMGSNYSKNLLYDSCIFSRFDAHKGVANATIRNSTLGHMGINAIGSGTFTVENSTIRGNSIINLRSDYGSTWQGSFVIRDCTFIPAGGRPVQAALINGSYSGQHDFGYTCYMPEKITIQNLFIDDTSHPEKYQGPAIFANFNPNRTNDSYREPFPYILTKAVILENVTTASGLELRRSDNPFMFEKVKIISK
ncbi:MAG TPA: right-handed parallel beta-helix repeat-containing protein [Saprospiraceae bacterium]|nr:right-handed parallel beta-helix repeat-containing protein [Saprospiraceae bacterium]